jgi:hypothetical protein
MAVSGASGLVHGGFVDGSGWSGVYDILKKERADLFAGTAARFYCMNGIWLTATARSLSI